MLEEKFAFLIEHTPLAIIEWNPAFQVVGWNPAAEKMFGYAAQEIYLQHASIIVPEIYREHVDAVMTALLQQAGGTYSLNENVTKAGQVITCEWVNTPLIGPNNQPVGIYSIVQDVTKRHQAEQALQASEAQLLKKSLALEEALRDLQQAQLHLVQNEKMLALGNLVAGVAHEINNPLGFLRGNLQPITDYVQDVLDLLDLYDQIYPDLDPQLQDKIAEIDLDYIRDDLPKLISSMQVGIDRIRNISTSLRIFSRADTDHPVKFNLHEGLDSTLLILKHRLNGNDYRPMIEVIKEYGPIPEVECFAGQLNQVFMNLLANAIDAIDEACSSNQDPTTPITPPRITVTTEYAEAAGQAIVCFQDTGLGMSEETLAHIFDHLFTTKGVGKGTGLGLTLSREIVEEKHGGCLRVESKLGQGTKFFVVLPLCRVPARP